MCFVTFACVFRMWLGYQAIRDFKAELKELSDKLSVAEAVVKRSSCNHWAVFMSEGAVAAVKKCNHEHAAAIKEGLPLVCGEFVSIGVAPTARGDNTEKCVWRKVVPIGETDVFIFWSCTYGGWVFSRRLELDEPNGSWDTNVIAWAAEDKDDPEMSDVLPSARTVAIPPHSKSPAGVLCGASLVEFEPYGQWAWLQLQNKPSGSASAASIDPEQGIPADQCDVPNYGHPDYNGPVKFGWTERAAKISALFETWDTEGAAQCIAHYKSRYPGFSRALHRFTKYGVPEEL